MGFYFSQKDLVLNPSFLIWPQPVDRRARTCTPVLTGGPADRPGRPSRELCSLERPRPTERSIGQRALLSVSWLGRPTGRPMTQRSEIWPWPVDRAVDRQLCQTPTASFPDSIKGGIWGLFWLRFLETFRASFSYSFQRVFSTKFRANTSN